MNGLIRDGVSGLIVCGTFGENTSLCRSERLAVTETAKAASAGPVPVIAAIAEFTTQFASEVVKEAARVDLAGILRVTGGVTVWDMDQA